jgi:Zn-dependent protease/predicted transcriptional regulator
MRGTRVGSIFGIDIRIDASWFVILLLVFWTLSRGVFPASHPGQSTAVYFAMGAAGTVLFFMSLLAHELSHSLVARRRGVEVREITLFIFGGMARASSEFGKPADELVVAAAGPVASLLIAALFQGVAWSGTLLGAPPAFIAVASYLAMINTVLAVFNMFPGFPLDGGRVLRALIWHRTGDLKRATRIAAGGGRVFSFMLMAFGLLSLLAGNLVGGVWLLLIGWFVRAAADASFEQVLMRDRLAHARAQDIMTPHPRTVPPDLALSELVEQHVLGGRFQSYPVVEHGHAVGLITLECVRSVPKAEWATRTVREAMVPIGTDVAIEPEDPVSSALDRLSSSRLRRLLVTHDGQLLGIISLTDVAHWLERERLRDELAGAAQGMARP